MFRRYVPVSSFYYSLPASLILTLILLIVDKRSPSENCSLVCVRPVLTAPTRATPGVPSSHPLSKMSSDAAAAAAPAADSSATDKVADSDLQVETFDAGKKVTMEEVGALGGDDESLQRYKAQILAEAGMSDIATGDKHVIIRSMAICSEGRDDMVFRMETAAERLVLATTVIQMMEGVEYTMKFTFAVFNEIVSGLSYAQVLKRGPIKDKDSYAFGSYPPTGKDRAVSTATMDVPSGRLARGTYTCRGRFSDADSGIHSDVEFKLKIAKTWT